MSLKRKMVEIVNTDGDNVSVIFELGAKRLVNSAVLEKVYEIRVGNQSIGLSETEFVGLRQLLKDWFTS